MCMPHTKLHDAPTSRYPTQIVKGSCPSGRLNLRCSIEEEIFTSLGHLAKETSAGVHRLQCPVVFSSGAEDAGNEGNYASLLPTAARALATRCMDAAYMPFPKGDHFMPFCAPGALAWGLRRSLVPLDGGVGLREHVRWLACALATEQLQQERMRLHLLRPKF
jgi:hypothetical protein